MSSVSYLIVNTVYNFVQLYLLLIIVRILLSWFQTVDWAANIISFLAPITDPYLNIFRSIIPPVGGLDLSPILAIFILQLIPQLLGAVFQMVG
ncbi:MAG: YggT family protein [Geminocystis sp.]|nr:YggT family protein [Geminocystis sp.]HIK37280.1 YggT family protein [Geminocystis sp. M7585_C2015_104]MCS7148235.1 YggT family protein [Geminocystis sp.]MCX8077650.1 YggT family protein [Geminocystis sp.]MDW8116542.1 YggT family protein [Geminocystis sp.]